MKVLDPLLSLLLRNIAAWRYQRHAEAVLVRVRGLIRDCPPTSELRSLIDALILAEDRRFLSHHGVDVRSILRAILVTALTSRVQGASTITQQLARVITGDYRVTFARKFKELCLAAWIDSKVAKQEQAAAYLCVAYFGWRMNGLKQAAARLNAKLPCSAIEAAAIVARLKYPEPQQASPDRLRQIQDRQAYVLRMLETHRDKSSRTSNTV